MKKLEVFFAAGASIGFSARWIAGNAQRLRIGCVRVWFEGLKGGLNGTESATNA